MIKYTYSDGSGNAYIVTFNSIEYKPVNPDLSSSGFYSGGKPKEKEISEKQYKYITAKFQKAASDTSILIKNRLMGAGQIKIQDGNKTAVYILEPRAELKSEIEDYLFKFFV